jgi:hypothetical protein
MLSFPVIRVYIPVLCDMTPEKARKDKDIYRNLKVFLPAVWKIS